MEKITFDRRLKVQRGAILTNTAPGAVPAEGKPPQNKRGQKNFCSTKNGVFFSAASCKKDTIFGAAEKIFQSFLFRDGFNENMYPLKFIYSEKATKFVKSPSYFCPM